MNISNLALVDLRQNDFSDNAVENNNRPWLKGLHKPWWLLNDIYSDKWVVTDRTQQPPQTIDWNYLFADSNGNLFNLIDPEKSHLLETVQLVCFHMRESQLATCDTSAIQTVTALKLKTIIAWMCLNNIFRFAQLTDLEFEKYKRECIFGISKLLDASGRLERYVDSIRQNGGRLPSKPRAKSYIGNYVIDLESIDATIGLNYQSQMCINPIIAYQLAKLTREEGFYITNTQLKRLEKGVPTKSIMDAGSVENLILPWRRLWDLRTELNDTIQFDPFDGTSAKLVAKNAIKEAGEVHEDSYTGTIPEYQASFLIDRALRWVINYSDDLLDLRDKYENIFREYELNKGQTNSVSNNTKWYTIKGKMNNLLNSYELTGFEIDDLKFPSRPWPLIPEFSTQSNKHLTLHKAVNNFLPVACLIVICAFTANRHEAGFNIYDNNPQEGDPNKPAIEADTEGDWLWTWVGKSSRNWDRVPCPRVVKKAVEVLHALSQSARNMTGSRMLFQIKKIGSNEILGLTGIGDNLKNFANFVEVPPLEDGTHWNFTLHQFRKFFAILYMFGYEHGNLSALSYHMRHLDFKVTEDYVLKHSNDTALAKMRKHRSADLLVEIANGKRKASGKAGKYLSGMMDKLVKQAVKNVKLISVNSSPEAARRIAERVMQKLELELIPFMWGYCAAFKKLGHGNFAGNCIECRMQADGPDLTKATPKNCSGCNHFYTDQHFESWWESMAAIYGEHLNNPNLPDIFVTYTKEMAEMFRKGIKDYFGDSAQVIS